MRNRIRKIRLKQRQGPWPIGSELLLNGDVFIVKEYERARDGYWVALLRVEDELPVFWKVATLRSRLKSN